MCITIPSSANIDRSRQLPLWQWLIDSPIRLLSAGGGISICLGLLHWRYGMSVADGWLSFNLLYGVLPFFLFPQLLAYLPSRLKVSPLRYVGYGSLFFLMLAAQLVFYLSIILGDRPGMTYLLLTLMAWLFILRVIINFLRSSYMAGRLWHRGLLISLLWGVASGCMAGLFLISGSITTAPLSLLAGASYILPASLFYLILRYSN